MHTEPWIDDGHRIDAHATGADRMIDGVSAPADAPNEGFVVVAVRK